MKLCFLLFTYLKLVTIKIIKIKILFQFICVFFSVRHFYLIFSIKPLTTAGLKQRQVIFVKDEEAQILYYVHTHTHAHACVYLTSALVNINS